MVLMCLSQELTRLMMISLPLSYLLRQPRRCSCNPREFVEDHENGNSCKRILRTDWWGGGCVDVLAVLWWMLGVGDGGSEKGGGGVRGEG